MPGDDRRGLSCPRSAGARCPGPSCPGEADPGICRHLARLQGWRGLPIESQAAAIWAGDADFRPSDEPAAGRLRVGLWCPCLGLGGAESWQLALARAVDPGRIAWMGAAVIEGRGATETRMVAELGSIMPVGFGLNAAKALASRSDVILSWAVTEVSGLLRGLDEPPSIVMACHFPAESPWGEGTDSLLAGVDRFVAVSELAAESTSPSIRDRVEVIWNAVDARRMEVRRDRPTLRGSWGIPADALVAGYLGRLSPEKDPDAMLRLVAELPEPWHVAIVGEGRERGSLAGTIRGLGLRRAHLVGGDLSSGDVLNAFDTLVVPSRYESFGLTLAEGLWAGVPVLSTRSGLAKLAPGLVREIGVGAEGRAIARALLEDHEDREGTRARVDRARTFARGRLGLERFAREWADLLLRSAASRKERSPCSTTSRVA